MLSRFHFIFVHIHPQVHCADANNLNRSCTSVSLSDDLRVLEVTEVVQEVCSRSHDDHSKLEIQGGLICLRSGSEGVFPDQKVHRYSES